MHVFDDKPISLSPDPWRWLLPFQHCAHYVFAFPAFNAILFGLAGITISISILSVFHGVHVGLWLYNMALRFMGHSFTQWLTRATKLVFPTLPDAAPNVSTCVSTLYDQCSLTDHYAVPPSIPPVNSKQRRATKRHLLSTLLASMAVLHQPLASADMIQRTRDKMDQTMLKKCRSLQGDLRTTNLKPHQLEAVHEHVKVSNDLFANAATLCPHAFTSILDSGCSRSAVPLFSMVRPGSIKKLSKPISLGGIAGDLLIEYVGETEWETLNEDGEVVPFVEEVLIHTALPGILISPQSFLAKNSAGEPVGCVKDHFCIFHDCAEWHVKGK